MPSEVRQRRIKSSFPRRRRRKQASGNWQKAKTLDSRSHGNDSCSGFDASMCVNIDTHQKSSCHFDTICKARRWGGETAKMSKYLLT